MRRLAVETFVRVGCAGLARVDFFVEGDRVLVNELNTLPGFTPDLGLRVAVGGERRRASPSSATACSRSPSSALTADAASRRTSGIDLYAHSER